MTDELRTGKGDEIYFKNYGGNTGLYYRYNLLIPFTKQTIWLEFYQDTHTGIITRTASNNYDSPDLKIEKAYLEEAARNDDIK